MTLYSTLAAAGHQSVLDQAHAARRHTSHATITTITTAPGTEPVVALEYMVDFAAEQETGAATLRRRLLRAMDPDHPLGRIEATDGVEVTGPHQGDLVTSREDALLLHSRRGPSDFALRDYATGHFGSDPVVRETRWALETKSMPDLYALFREHQTPLPARRTRRDLVEALAPVVAPTQGASRRGWFADGHTLAIPRGQGVFAVVVEHIEAAAAKGTLYTGSLLTPFAGGLLLFDGDEVPDTVVEGIAAERRWAREQMQAVAPIKEALAAQGYRVYLGDPKRRSNGQTAYWLNAYPYDGGKQVYGYFTAEELRHESLLAPA